jgi:hypothetical protein
MIHCGTAFEVNLVLNLYQFVAEKAILIHRVK